MKICFLAETYPPYQGGSETFLKDLIEELRKKHSILLITRSHPKAREHEEKENLKIYRVYNFPFPRIHKYLVMGFVTYFKGKHLIADYDIINVQNISPWLAGSLFKRKYGLPYVQVIEAIPSAFAKNVARFLYRRFLKVCNCDKLIVWTKELKKLMGIWGLEAEVIRYGIDLEKFSPKISGKEIKEKYGSPLLVTAKPLYKNNAIGISYLIQAMKVIEGRLLILGDGKYRRWLEDLVKQAKLQRKVIFVGHVPHDSISIYYAAADIILNSIIFDIGVRPSLSLLESMAMEKPVLLTKNVESNEINKSNLCLARIGDVKDIVEKIKLLLTDRKYAKKIARNARKMVERRYDIKLVAKKLIELYESLV
jgi:glycosyltransferase involved in cell wall biosynthesis